MESFSLGERAQRALKIIASPQNFKVCEGCDSIVATRVATCPNCHGYRFNEDAEAVSQQAQLLAGREQRTVTAQDLVN
ncbi:MAG TPA: hypothetical protein VIS74_02120 [Chthoniobacterales bacterium]